MLNKELQWTDAAARLADVGRTQLPGLLEPALADSLFTCLHGEVPWSLALRDDEASRTLSAEEYARLDDAQRREILDACSKRAVNGFSFAYESYQMITAYLAKQNPDLLLHRMVEALNSPQFLGFARELTGDNRIVKADCQATSYRPGHFLTLHDDTYEDEGRLFAFVLSLTRRWRADWGGLLHFADRSGRVIDTFVPAFNTFNVFKVPIHHCVSMVTPFAGEPRYSITGWLRSA
ncbi:MAG: 2OG-Fe(II) oxygenase family protein [Xanthomonadales bacterium]|nr:2OG-Fe(II) oxygenase family protein [Xanthomonadales bacterium]